jgi:hypothetical protein
MLLFLRLTKVFVSFIRYKKSLYSEITSPIIVCPIHLPSSIEKRGELVFHRYFDTEIPCFLCSFQSYPIYTQYSTATRSPNRDCGELSRLRYD